MPWLLPAHLASSCSFFLPLLQDSSQPADGTKCFWICKLTWYSLSNDAIHDRGLAETSLYKDKSTLFLGLNGLHDKMTRPHWRRSKCKCFFLKLHHLTFLLQLRYTSVPVPGVLQSSSSVCTRGPALLWAPLPRGSLKCWAELPVLHSEPLLICFTYGSVSMLIPVS